MWDIHLNLSEVTPSSRRRSYSDPRKRSVLRLPLRKRSVSPPRYAFKENGCNTGEGRYPSMGSPTSSGYGSGSIEGPSACSASAPVNANNMTPITDNIFFRDGQEGSPRSSSPYSQYAGLALGSPLGSGPLNGHPLNMHHACLSPVSEISTMEFLPSSTSMDLLPIRRPRINSLSEVPSVAPIPENLPLMDTPPRPPLRQEDLEPLPQANAGRDVNIGSGKTPQTGDGKMGTDGSGTQVSGLLPKEQDRSKQQQDESDGNIISSTPQQQQPQGFRPRAGTWSIANSRRAKIKQEKEEEAAKLRQRRKSGDDITAATNPPQPFSAAAGRREDQPLGFFDSFRPRSKSDAKAILQSRQRRKSGDDLLNAATKDKEKKKEVTPGFLESFRPRSKSDAARGKKPNIMTTMKNAVQQTLVSPGGNNRGGRRSGEATPVEPHANDDVYHTWHAGSGPKSTIGKVWELFRHNKTNETSEDRQRRKSGGKHDKGQLHRRHSMDPDRRRHGSGGFGAPYIRGDDPNQAAILFRDCRGLPAAAPFLENFKRSELEEDESQILVKFFKYHHTYDLIPTSAKLVIFDTRLQVKKAFYALVYNGVRAAPLWDAVRQEFVGMLTITDFIRILQSFYNSANRKMEELEDHRLEMWRTLLSDDNRKLISIGPNECLYDAIRALIHQKIHRLPVIDPLTGNVLYIITHKRILKFLYLYINELPKPMVLQKSLRELDIGTYDRIETARGETLIIEALNKFVERRISALPIVDDEGKLIDIYAKFDVINLAAEGTYHNLDVTLHQANEYRNEWFEGVLKCDLDESLGVVMERIVRAEVHRLVVVDKSNKVIGIISLSDILNELVLKPCNDDPLSMRNRTIGQMETTLSGGNPSPEINVESLSSDNEIQNSGGTAGDEDWGGTSDLSISEDKLQERKSSAESEENFDLEVNNLPDSMTSQGVISISS